MKKAKWNTNKSIKFLEIYLLFSDHRWKNRHRLWHHPVQRIVYAWLDGGQQLPFAGALRVSWKGRKQFENLRIMVTRWTDARWINYGRLPKYSIQAVHRCSHCMANASEAESKQSKSSIGHSCTACGKWSRYLHNNTGGIPSKLLRFLSWNAGSPTTTSLWAGPQRFTPDCKCTTSIYFHQILLYLILCFSCRKAILTVATNRLYTKY